MEIKETAKKYFEDLVALIKIINLDEIEAFAIELAELYRLRKNIFIMGNGGSGSTASHFACDINKGVSINLPVRFKVLCLNDNIPTMLAYANDISYEDIFVEQLKNYLVEGDLVIGISGSGNSPNVLKAIEYANLNGAHTFGISGFDGGQLKNISNKSIIIKSFDMQKVEDCHMILVHIIMQYFKN
jgi:D-sedoheptulose 7-phosphate isomerase